MKFLFVHQNMPGQYRELVKYLAAQPEHDVVFLTQRLDLELKNVRKIPYRPWHAPKPGVFKLSEEWERVTGVGLGAVRALQAFMAETDWTPDIIIGHVGWGETLFMKDALPDVPIIGFFEYFYVLNGGIKGFDPKDRPTEWTPFILSARNQVSFASIHSVDLGHSPTMWQRNTYPESFHSKMYVCHDGIRTDRLRPDPNARINLMREGRPFTRQDEIVTYMARSLEPTRGFPTMMRAIPKILKERPNARVVIIGKNANSYGGKSKHPEGYRGEMLEELGDQIDLSRVHFLGRVPYADFQRVIQVSSCHVYLSMPFVLSWSLLESMSMGATVVASDVESVREVIKHRDTGFLVDFFDPEALANQVVDVLQNRDSSSAIGRNARKLIERRYDFLNVCLPTHLQQIRNLTGKPV